MALTQNNLAGFLAVYAQKSLNAFLADMPPRDLFTENFDDSIANGGISVTTRIPTTPTRCPPEITCTILPTKTP